MHDISCAIENCDGSGRTDIVKLKEGDVKLGIVGVDGRWAHSTAELVEHGVVATQILIQHEVQDTVLAHFTHQQHFLLLVDLEPCWEGQAAQGQALHLLRLPTDHKHTPKLVLY